MYIFAMMVCCGCGVCNVNTQRAREMSAGCFVEKFYWRRTSSEVRKKDVESLISDAEGREDNEIRFSISGPLEESVEIAVHESPYPSCTLDDKGKRANV